MIEELLSESPHRAAALRLLYQRFLEKSFLPSLYDVNLFIQRNCEKPKTLRARAAAPSTVFRVLADMPEQQFQSILAENELRAAGKSDLEIISDAILGRSR